MSGPPGCQGATARRTPRQQRGQQTLDALVTAAAGLLDEVGYERVTTKAIAARAGTSIGAFYQFFANKDDVIAALASRYRTQVRAYLDSAVGAPPSDGVTDTWVSRLLIGLAEVFQNMPGFRGVWSGRLREGSLGEQARTLRQEVFDALDDRLGAVFPGVPSEARRRCLGVAVEAVHLLMSHADDPKQTFNELVRMLGPYLASYFGPVAATAPIVVIPAAQSGG